MGGGGEEDINKGNGGAEREGGAIIIGAVVFGGMSCDMGKGGAGSTRELKGGICSVDGVSVEKGVGPTKIALAVAGLPPLADGEVTDVGGSQRLRSQPALGEEESSGGASVERSSSPVVFFGCKEDDRDPLARFPMELLSIRAGLPVRCPPEREGAPVLPVLVQLALAVVLAISGVALGRPEGSTVPSRALVVVVVGRCFSPVPSSA